MMLGFGGKMSSQIATQGCHEVSGNYLNSNNKSERFKGKLTTCSKLFFSRFWIGGGRGPWVVGYGVKQCFKTCVLQVKNTKYIILCESFIILCLFHFDNILATSK